VIATCERSIIGKVECVPIEGSTLGTVASLVRRDHVASGYLELWSDVTIRCPSRACIHRGARACARKLTSMNLHSASIATGWLAVLLGFIVAYAQCNRLTRRGTEGVSLATWVLFVYVACFWISYGIDVRSWEVVAGSLVALPLQLRILLQLKPWQHRSIVLRALAFFALSCFAPALFWGWSGAVIGVGVAGSITRGPQLIRLLRHQGALGVSVGSWLLAVVVSGLWVVYYSGAHLWAVLVVTALAGLLSLTIAVLAGWRQHQTRQLQISF
jgi:uncharacterized protein with PQ loop repeat